MKIPGNIKIYDWPDSTFWFDEEGIFCVISKNTPPGTLAEAKKTLENLKKVIGENKVCMLIDVTKNGESTKEMRDYAAVEFPKFIKAIAMVSRSALGTMLANLFFSIKSQPYPTKMFNDENEARKWIKKYL